MKREAPFIVFDVGSSGGVELLEEIFLEDKQKCLENCWFY